MLFEAFSLLVLVSKVSTHNIKYNQHTYRVHIGDDIRALVALVLHSVAVLALLVRIVTRQTQQRVGLGIHFAFLSIAG